MRIRKSAFGALTLALMLPILRADIEKTPIKLAVVPDFGAGVDWGAVFSGYQGRGTYKNLVRMSDGRWIVADSRTYNFLFFDENGRFLKKLLKTGLRKAESHSPVNRPEWISLLADKYLFVSEPGRIRLFDLDGKEIRSTAIGHPVQCFEALDERTLAVAGSMERADLPKRYVAGLVDLETGKETIVMDSIESSPKKKAVPLTEDGNKTMSVDYPYAKIQSFVRKTPEGGFLAGFSNWPEIEIYDKAGKQLRIIMLKTERAAFEKRLIDSFAWRAKTMEDFGKLEIPSLKVLGGFYGLPESSIGYSTREGITVFGNPYGLPENSLNYKTVTNNDGKTYKAVLVPSGFSQNHPYYYNLIINDEGKILVFYFPAEGDKPVYQTYTLDGDLAQEVVLDPGELEFLLTPAAQGIAFYKGDLYGLAEKTDAKGIRLRFVKCLLRLGSSGEKN